MKVLLIHKDLYIKTQTKNVNNYVNNKNIPYIAILG